MCVEIGCSTALKHMKVDNNEVELRFEMNDPDSIKQMNKFYDHHARYLKFTDFIDIVTIMKSLSHVI